MIFLQQDNCYSLFCTFLSLYEWKSVTSLKVKPGRQSLEKGLLCVFQATGIILSQRCRARITKHSKQSTNVRAKGIDPIWCQVCSSLLQFSPVNVHSTIFWEKGCWPLWLLPAEQRPWGGNCVMELINLGLEVLPRPRLGMNSLHRIPFLWSFTILRQALECTYKLGIRIPTKLCAMLSLYLFFFYTAGSLYL